jgi:hypothetical protein
LPLKVDLGKVFPGIIISIIGIVLLIIWLIIEIVSFFVPLNLQFSVLLLIIALGCIIGGTIQIFRGISGIRKRIL